MALVDGGILNNVPAAILPERGADLVIGIDVAAKLAQRFTGNTPATQFQQMRRQACSKPSCAPTKCKITTSTLYKQAEWIS
jgi:predicted acylesterase/phospholipase RssA